jgi:hypothetical protein
LLGKNYDYIVEIVTELEKNEFEYKDSRIGPVVKATVNYYKPSQDDEKPPVHYENLWFRDWQSLGLRRYNALDLGDSSQVAIHVKHKAGLGSLSEGEAAAKSIVRLFVDLYAEKHAVATIIVPDDSMAHILNQMPRAGFTPGQEARPDVPVYSPIVIPIRSQSGHHNMVLYYTNPPKAESFE